MAPVPLTSVVVVARSQPGIAELSHVTATLSAFLDRSSSLPLARVCAVGSVSLLQRVWDVSKAPETVTDPWCQPTNTWCPSRMLWTNRFYYQDQFAKGMVEACTHADVSTVQWLVDQFTGCIVPPEAVEAAAHRGRQEILQVLLRVHEKHKKKSTPGAPDRAEKKPHQVKFWESNALLAAATGGHGDLVIWLYTDVFHGFYMQSNQEVMDELARHGEIEAVRRLVVDGWQPPRLDFAAEGGNLALVMWLLDQNRAVGKQWATKNAASKGHLEIVKLLVHEDIAYLDGEAFCDAATNGHLLVVQWLKEKNLGWKLAYKAIDLAASNGHLEVVQYLHSNCSATYIMDVAATCGNLEMIKWLHEHSAAKFSPMAMDGAAKEGRLAVIQWLHEILPEGCTVKAVDEAASMGHLDVVQWLCANRSEGCSTKALDGSTSGDHFDVALLLASKYPELGDNADHEFIDNHNIRAWMKETYPSRR
ncbi:hypothetical protein JG687_00012611 [Phytophthora cactorum]|uniref:Ankyrin repeat-containing domain n=1 Tax=Phytophthora cactorum TaxID=29920 RepID=A0A8T1U1B2_9STRA|nr:hypothetical protein JG687_00012611 [Phytophthora cactorum]